MINMIVFVKSQWVVLFVYGPEWSIGVGRKRVGLHAGKNSYSGSMGMDFPDPGWVSGRGEDDPGYRTGSG